MNLYSTTYKFEHIYDLNKLKDYARYADRDIQRALEYIETVKQYRLSIHEHAQHVAMSEFEYVILLQRRTDYHNKVNYDVMAIHRPIGISIVNGAKVSGTYHDSKVFAGKERHEAIKYAQTLSEKYNCSIEKSGFPRK